MPDFLRLIEAIFGRAADWGAAAVPIEQVPILEPTFRRTSAARRLAVDFPWSEAVLRVLETRAYAARSRHSNSFIAHALGIRPDQVAEIVLALAEAHIIEPHGDSYRVLGTLVVDTNVEREAYARSRRHWAEVALGRIQNEQHTWFSYNVISVSQRDYERVEQRLRAAFREVRGIVKASEPCEQPALLTIQLSRWDLDQGDED